MNKWLLVTTAILCASVAEAQSAGSKYDVQTANGSGGFLSGVTSQANVGKVGNIAAKPGAADEIRFVTPEGNDSNDCMSLGSACLTLDAALESLPGGSASAPLTAGAGEVDVVGTVAASSAASNCGFWLMGAQDPNYASPPTCWLHASGGKGLTVRCIGPNASAPISWRPVCLQGWGSSADRMHPAYWFSALFSQSIHMIDIFNNYSGTIGKIGIDSNGHRTTGTNASGATNIDLDGTGGQIDGATFPCGPALDIGGNTFWIRIHDSTWISCTNSSVTAPAEVFPISTISRSSNVVTVTTSSTNDLTVGAFVTIQNVADNTYNSVKSGTEIITSVSGSPQTTFTFNQVGPNSSSSGGQAYGDAAAAINIDPLPGGSASGGIIYIDNTNMSYGGIRYTLGSSGTGINVTNAFCEAMSMPCAGFINLGTTSNSYVANVGGADPIYGAAGLVENDTPTSSPESLVVDSSSSIVAGPADVRGTYPADWQDQTQSMYQQHQVGFEGGYVFGQTDISRRQFGPVAVRTPNLALSGTSSWTTIGGTSVTVGQTAPDGTSGAASITSTSGGGQTFLMFQGPIAINIGDSYVFGAWTRATSSNGYSQSSPLTFQLTALGYGTGDTCSVPGGEIITVPVFFGDTQWDWTYGVCTVATNPSNAGISLENIMLDATHPIMAYAPIVLHLAAGTYSPNEVWNIAASLQSFDQLCAVGTVCGLRGQMQVADHIGTLSNCSSSASPAVCGTASSGNVVVAASATTVVVDTTQVTANSQIQLTFDSSLGARLGVTCNTTAVQPTVSARTAGTSFTLKVPTAPATNPACFSYSVVN